MDSEIELPYWNEGANRSYYPVLFKNEEQCLDIQEFLAGAGIGTRRYFYPSLNQLSFVKNETMPVAESIAKRVLSLPLHFQLKHSEIDEVCQLLKSRLR